MLNGHRRGWVAGIALGVGIAAITPLWALTDEEIFRQLRFNFINPGGRALGLAGASIAAVNDSTAALTNPGAMTGLEGKEFFVEYRGIDEAGLQLTTFSDADVDVARSEQLLNSTGVTFSSLVFPWRSGSGEKRRSWAAALSYQRVLDTKVRGGPLPAGPNRPPICIGGTGNLNQCLGYDVESAPGARVTEYTTGSLDLGVDQINAVLAAQVHANWSIGLTASYGQMDITSFTDNRTLDPAGVVTTNDPNEIVDPAGVFQFGSRIGDRSDKSFGYSLGILWVPRSYYKYREDPPIRLGLVWNSGPKFEVGQETLAANGLVTGEIPFTLKIPDRYGIGLAYERRVGRQDLNRILCAFDAVRVQYSDLLDGFQTGRNAFTNPTRRIDGALTTVDYEYEDGTEARIGFEWKRKPGVKSPWDFGFRAGYARLPSSAVSATNVVAGSDRIERIVHGLYPGGEYENAVAAGFSASFALPQSPVQCQLDLGYLSGEETDQAVVSLILRF